MRKNGDVNTQVQLIVWNMIKSQKDAPADVGGISLSFTPSSVSADILTACNARLVNLAKSEDFTGLFAGGGPDVSDEEFLQSSVAGMRQLADNVLKPSEELGMPCVHMVTALVDS